MTESGAIDISEKRFEAQVKELATKYLNWTYYHTHRSQFSPAGFPDCVFVRERIVFAELKVGKNKPTAAQQEWLDRIAGAGGEVYLWYPEDWAEIKDVLERFVGENG